MSLPTNIQPTTPTTDPVLDHAAMHNTENAQINANTAAISLLAPINSPTFTGTVTVPTPVNGTDAATKTYVDSNGGGTTVYTNSNPTPVALGGIAAGSTFSSVPITSVFNSLLYPFQYPAFTSFSISSQSNPVEVGTAITGSQTFLWSTSNSSNITSNTIILRDNGSVISSPGANTGSRSASVIGATLTAPGSHSYSISGTDTQSNTFSSTYTINWYWRLFAGTSTNTTLTATQIQALTTSNLQAGNTGTYSFATGGYKFICYPSTFAAANQFTDTSTNLTVTMADSTDDSSFSNTANGLSYALISVTNAFSQTVTYQVYRTKYILGGSINIQVT